MTGRSVTCKSAFVTSNCCLHLLENLLICWFLTVFPTGSPADCDKIAPLLPRPPKAVRTEFCGRFPRRVERAGASGRRRMFLDGSFASAKNKKASESEKPSKARGRSGWWWSMARLFLRETTFAPHPRWVMLLLNDKNVAV